MRRFLNLIAVIGISVGVAGAAHAQNRVFGAQSFMMDDGAGHTYLLQAPAGMTGNVIYNMPLPPPGNPPAGFVNVGTSAGQTLYWNSVNKDWEASSVITNNTNGNGTNVTITAPTIETSTGNRIGPAAPGTDGNYLTINGATGGATELQVNGDVNITGNLGPVGLGIFTTLQVTNLQSNPHGGTINLQDALSAGANNISGSNFSISGGTITGTPISGSTGSFTTLAASTSETFSNLLPGDVVFTNGSSALATTNNFTWAAGTFGVTGTSNLTGATNINTSGTALTQIGTAGGNTSIGAAASTNTIIGATGITGVTNINTSGGAGTAIGNSGVGAGGVNIESVGSVRVNTDATAGNTLIGNGGTVTVNGSTNTITATTANAINGPTNITGATTVVGTTLINNSGTAATTIGNGAGVSNTTINVGTGASNLALTGIANDPLPTQMLTLNGSNNVRVTTLSGTANEGLVFTNVGGTNAYRLGSAAGDPANAFAANRTVSLAGNTLTFNNTGAVGFASLNGNTSAIGLNNVGSGNTSIGNTGTVTVNGSTNTITATTANNINGATNVTGATTVVGTTLINNSGTANTTIGNNGVGATSVTLDAGSTGTVAVNGTTNVTGATTVVGTTLINNSGTASTTIGNTGAGTTSSTTINVGTTAGNLVLNGIVNNSATNSFLTLDGSNNVRTNALSNFIQGTNGVLVTYSGGVATVQFASTNGVGAGPNTVAFQSDRYINTAAQTLHITNNTAGTDFATFNGNSNAINLNNATVGTTTIGNGTNGTSVVITSAPSAGNGWSATGAGALASTGSATIATGSGTNNTFGNGLNAVNNIGTGGGVTSSNNFGNNANNNQFGGIATTNTFGNSATTNQFGHGGASNSDFGGATTGTDNFGTTAGTNNYNGVSNFTGNLTTNANSITGTGTYTAGNLVANPTAGAGLTINNTGAGNDVTGTGGTWSVTKTGAATFTSTNGGAGTFTTLTSSGNSTIATGAAATTNSFGTGNSNAVAVANTIGSSFAGSLTTINGAVTHNGATQINNTLGVTGLTTTAGITDVGTITQTGPTGLNGVTTQTGNFNLAGATSQLQMQGSAGAQNSILQSNNTNTPSWTLTPNLTSGTFQNLFVNPLTNTVGITIAGSSTGNDITGNSWNVNHGGGITSTALNAGSGTIQTTGAGNFGTLSSTQTTNLATAAGFAVGINSSGTSTGGTQIGNTTGTIGMTGANIFENGHVQLNTSGTLATDINTGTATGAVTIGNNGNVANATHILSSNTDITGNLTVNATVGTATTALGTGAGAGAVSIGRPGGSTTILGVTSINAPGNDATSIGTGGAGAVNIGNSTGNTIVTGSLVSNPFTQVTDATPTGEDAGAFIWQSPVGTSYTAGILNTGGAANASALIAKTTATAATNRIFTANSGGTDRFVVFGNGAISAPGALTGGAASFTSLTVTPGLSSLQALTQVGVASINGSGANATTIGNGAAGATVAITSDGNWGITAAGVLTDGAVGSTMNSSGNGTNLAITNTNATGTALTVTANTVVGATALNVTGALAMAGSAGTSGQLLSSNGTGATPSWINGTLAGDVHGPFGANLISATAGNDIDDAISNAATNHNIGNTNISITAGAGSFTSLSSGGTVTFSNVIQAGPLAGVTHSSAAGVLSSSAVNLASNGAGGDVTGVLAVANGGTGSSTQNFVDLTTNQNPIAGNKTFTGNTTFTAAGTTVILNGQIESSTIGSVTASTGKFTTLASNNVTTLATTGSNPGSTIGNNVAGSTLALTGGTVWSMDASGNLATTGTVTAGVASSNRFAGRVSVAAATSPVTIANTQVTSTSAIILTYEDPSSGGYISSYVSSRVAGTSFNVVLSAVPPAGAMLDYIIIQ